MRLERLGEGGGERLVRERVEPVLPPHAQDAAAPRPCDPPAARSGRRAGRRRASAGRSSPIAASGPGRRPPRCSRSRRAPAGTPGPRRAGRAAPRNATPRSRAAGRSPGSHLRLRLSQQRRLAGDDEPAALHAVDLDREQRPGLDQVVEGELPSRRPHRQPVLDPELALRNTSRRRARTRPRRPAARGRGSATAACGGPVRAANAAPRGAPPGTAARSGRRRAGCLRAGRCRACRPRRAPRGSPGPGSSGRQYQSIASRGLDVASTTAARSVRIRSRSSSTSSACSSNVPPSWRVRSRSQLIRYHGSSAVGTSERLLL